jgi:NAD(P)H-dependent FMN reductase
MSFRNNGHRGEVDGADATPPRLLIVIGSTRPGRLGLPIAEWFRDRAIAHGGFVVDVADLADLNLPLLDEPNHPRLYDYTQPHTVQWSVQVAAADAFVFVTPEYNHGYTAPLKNAIDYLHREWQYKPVGFVSYGGVSGGIRAVQALKSVVSVLKMMPIPEGVPIPFVTRLLDENGLVQATETMEQGADVMLNELLRWVGALRSLRTPIVQPI